MARVVRTTSVIPKRFSKFEIFLLTLDFGRSSACEAAVRLFSSTALTKHWISFKSRVKPPLLFSWNNMFQLYHLINTKKTPYMTRHERERRHICKRRKIYEDDGRSSRSASGRVTAHEHGPVDHADWSR